MFGDIFDFDHDGETDAFEMALGFSIVFGSDEEKSKEDLFADEKDDDS